jgi:hypothetical protein
MGEMRSDHPKRSRTFEVDVHHDGTSTGRIGGELAQIDGLAVGHR